MCYIPNPTIISSFRPIAIKEQYNKAILGAWIVSIHNVNRAAPAKLHESIASTPTNNLKLIPEGVNPSNPPPVPDLPTISSNGPPQSPISRAAALILRAGRSTCHQSPAFCLGSTPRSGRWYHQVRLGAPLASILNLSCRLDYPMARNTQKDVMGSLGGEAVRGFEFFLSKRLPS